MKKEVSYSEVSIKDFLSEKGFMFVVLFYALLICFTIPLIIRVIYALFVFDIFTIVAGGLWIGLLVNHLRRQEMSVVLTILFFPYILAFAGLPFTQLFVPISNTGMYMLIIMFSGIMGLVMAYMLDRASSSFKSYVNSGVLFSSIMAVIFGISAGILKTIIILGEKLISLSTESGSATYLGLFSIFNIPNINITIAFILAFVFFKISFFIFYFKRKDKNAKKLLLYLIPIVLFVILSLASISIVDILMRSVATAL